MLLLECGNECGTDKKGKCGNECGTEYMRCQSMSRLFKCNLSFESGFRKNGLMQEFAVFVGVGRWQGETCRGDGAAAEANKQLVHQPKEAQLAPL